MKSFILRELFKPLVSRLGTAAAVWLVATLDVDASVAQQIETGFSAVMLVLADLILRHSVGTAK